jgi:hypothetical protein
MMPASAFVYIPKKGDAVLGCNASLKDTCCALLVELSLNYGKGLEAMHDLSMMDNVF